MTPHPLRGVETGAENFCLGNTRYAALPFRGCILAGSNPARRTMPDPLYLKSKHNCRAVFDNKCEREDKTVSHGDKVYIATDRTGSMIPDRILHEECYNRYGPSYLKDNTAKSVEEREARYEISPESPSFNLTENIREDVFHRLENITDHLQSYDLVKYDRGLRKVHKGIIEDHDVFIHPQILDKWAANEVNGNKPLMIGTITGTVTVDRFNFETYQEIKKFDYISVCPRNIPDTNMVLAQVDQVKKHEDGRTEATANIIGYRDDKGLMKKSRNTIDPDNYVYTATQRQVENTLELDTSGLEIGVMENNNDLNVYVQPEDLYQHMAIIAKTGYGKSYSMGVLVEEMLEQDMPVIIIDPHGEYSDLQYPNPNIEPDEKEKYDVEEKGYDVKVYTEDTRINPEAEQIKFKSKNMDFETFQKYCFEELSAAQTREMQKILVGLQEEGRDYGLDDVIVRVEERDMRKSTRDVLLQNLQSMKRSGIYSDNDYVTPEELVQPGQATVINLKGSAEVAEHVVNILAEQLFEQKKYGDLHPFMFIVEEAHNFIPTKKNKSSASQKILRQIAQEGRKFGMGLGVVSQRPSRIDRDVLSQCKLQLIFKVTNPTDLGSIQTSFENVTKEVKQYITGLPTGIGILLGKEHPVMADVRVRKSKHGGTSSV